LQVQANTVDFSCTCGQQFRARIDQGGKNRTCPQCGATVTIPKVAIGIVAGEPKSDRLPAPGTRFLSVPSSFSHFLAFLMVGWLSFALLLFIVSWFSVLLKYLALVLFLGATGATIQQIWQLLRARQRVLERKDVPLLWGFVRLIAWDPIQGVLILKNKSVSFSDDDLHDGQGGVRFLYPVLGEELALRVPLEVQTLRFADSKILTKEYLSVSVHGTMKWRIVDIRKFYLLVSRELRSTSDTRGSVTLSQPPVPSASAEVMLNSAIEWMRVIAEEQTRTVVSRAKSGLLIADRLNQEMPEVNSSSEIAVPPAQRRSAAEWGGATEGLASAIHDTIAQRLEGYGIAVEDVSLQEIRLPEEIVQECIAAAKAYYLPMRAQREASFKYANKQAELKAEVELLGRDNVGTREIVGAAPAFTLTEFLGQFLHNRINTGTNVGDAAIGMIAGQIAAGAQPAAIPAEREAAEKTTEP
jgi:regulator of protease activity HflC (stomatin/prohibitin superfamily)